MELEKLISDLIVEVAKLRFVAKLALYAYISNSILEKFFI